MTRILKAIKGEGKGRGPTDSIGKRIRTLRRSAGYSIGDIARLTSYDRTYVSQVEHDRTSPSFGFLQIFADVVGVSFGHILTGRHVKKRYVRGGKPEQVGNVLASVLDDLAENHKDRAPRRSDEAEPSAG